MENWQILTLCNTYSGKLLTASSKDQLVVKGNWGINLFLKKGQVKIQVRIKPDIFPRFKSENLLLKTARFPCSNLESKLK